MNATVDDRQSMGWLTALVGAVTVLVEVAGLYLLLNRVVGPDAAAYAGTGLVALLVGGSFLLVLGRQPLGPGDAAGKPLPMRVAELTVSITVLTLVTTLAAVCGLALALLAALGGPDPKTEDGDLLRNRLLGWVDRNRAFMYNNGRGTLPLAP